MAGEPESKKSKTELPDVTEGCLFAYGNPLLDISAEVDSKFLEKYGLEANNAILAEDKHKPIYEDMVANFDVEYVPGGATQNSIRVAQWLIREPAKACTYTGCIAKDKYGDTLEKKVVEDGVNAIYQYHDKEPTGTCAVLVTENGKHRSLVANLAAANCFSKDHLDKEENWKLVEKAQYYYISGFPLTVSPDSMVAIASHAAEKKKTFCMNLSAPFLCEFFKEPMMKVFKYVDILFANETEAATFSKVQEFGTDDITEIAKKAAALPKENKERSRIVVFTQGAENTVVVKDGEVKQFPVISIKAEDIVDCNGAGDAFVGGFLAQLVQGQSVDECINCAHYAANVIIQQSGVTLPEKPDYKSTK